MQCVSVDGPMGEPVPQPSGRPHAHQHVAATRALPRPPSPGKFHVMFLTSCHEDAQVGCVRAQGFPEPEEAEFAQAPKASGASPEKGSGSVPTQVVWLPSGRNDCHDDFLAERVFKDGNSFSAFISVISRTHKSWYYQ